MSYAIRQYNTAKDNNRNHDKVMQYNITYNITYKDAHIV